MYQVANENRTSSEIKCSNIDILLPCSELNKENELCVSLRLDITKVYYNGVLSSLFYHL